MENSKNLICRKCGKNADEPFFTIKRGKYTNLCRECKKEIDRKRYENNKIKIKKVQNGYYKNNSSNIKNKRKIYYWKNREIILQNNKNNIERKQRRNKNLRNRYKKEPNLVIKNRIRARMWELLKRNKTENTITLLGCSIIKCKEWLESKFLPNMTWGNYGEWEIDHILPCSFFDLTIKEQQIQCFHYTNLQPLWKEDNRSKRDYIKVLTSEGVFDV